MSKHATQPRTPGLATVVWAVLLQAPGAFLLGVSWASALVGPALWVVAVVATAVVVLGVSLGVSRLVAAVVTTALVVAVAYLASAGSGSSLLSTLTDAVPRLLTAPRPIPVTGELVAPGVLLLGVVAVVVAVRVTAARTAGVTPVVGGVVLYLAGMLLSSGTGDRYGLLAAVLAVVAVVGWVLAGRASSGALAPAAAVRRVGPVLLAALPVLCVGVVVTSLAPRSDAFEPRRLVTPPVERIDASSPMPQLAAWNQHPAVELFRVRGAYYPLRLVTLTSYDGIGWRAGTRYRPLGAYEQAGLPAGRRVTRLVTTVRLTDLTGPWLPSPGRVASVSRSDALVDPASGSLLVPGHRTRLGYSVRGDVDSPSRQALSGAGIPSTPQTQPYVAIPDLPAPLATYAAALVKDATTPYARAKAIERAVIGGRRFDPQAVGGSSYFRIQTFLLGRPGTPGAQAGTSEQFATAFAVLARKVGLPTRVVVGFRPGTALGGETRSVRGRDAFAWPEVYFTGLGWVPFSPTPEAGGFSQPDAAQKGPNSADQKDDSDATAVRPDDDGQGGTRPVGGAQHDTTRVVVGVALVLVVLGLPLGLLLARALRRRRHRAGGAPGAWQQLLDDARLAGIRADRHRPSTDTAVLIDRAAGAAGASTVATRAERAVFAPDAVVDDTVWEVARSTGRSLRRRQPWWRRAVWVLDPRAFRRGGATRRR